MALAETLATLGLIGTLAKVWDRWKQRKHERWILRLKRDRDNLMHEREEMTGEINDIELVLAVERELESC